MGEILSAFDMSCGLTGIMGDVIIKNQMHERG